jgi:hypothetical protein
VRYSYLKKVLCWASLPVSSLSPVLGSVKTH